MKERTMGQSFLLTLKGMAMGAADIVPGVSGGTIAFITGIYEELITSLNNINLQSVKVLRKEGFMAFWKHVNGRFFFFLLAGIAISLVSLVKVVTYLLENQEVLIWSFFFGLIIASIFMIGKQVKKWRPSTVAAIIVGTGIAFWISSIQTVATFDAKWYIFLSGAIAICAMILPGISGSFILLLMGSYHMILNGLKNLDLLVIGLFGSGCLVGLISFSRLLKYLFSKFHDQTVALLTGFMIGSLYKVWPWKIEVGDAPINVHSDGREDWMMANSMPGGFDGDPQLGMAIVCMVIGLGLILILDRFAPKEEK